MTFDRFTPRRTRRAATLGLAAVLACGAPEPSDGASTGGSSTASQTEGSSGPGTSTGGSGTTTGGSTGESSTGAPTTGGSSGDATTTGTSTGGSTGTGGAAPSFTEVYESILVPQGCTAGYCHGGMAAGLLMTDEATAYANLVEIAATLPVCGLSVRVIPGLPEESVMWRRVRPSALDMGDMCAGKMPEGSMGLDDPASQLVYDWIAGGALE